MIIRRSKIRFASFFLTVLTLAGWSYSAHAQHLINIATMPMQKGAGAENLFHIAHVTLDTLYKLDEARSVKQMDATPDGSRWYVVDEFAHWQYITIDGHAFPTRYHEIATTGTRISPNGDYFLWTGLIHAYTQYDFDSTTADFYKDTSLLFHAVSDYPLLEFSRSGEHWAAILPAANASQKDPGDFVLVDGTVVRHGASYPHQFAFSHDEQHWAYRTTDGLNERLMTDRSDSAVFMYKWPTPSATSTYDATIWRYTPDVTVNHKLFEGRDYDYGFDHVARVEKTAYSSLAADTLRYYVNFKGHNQGLYRWVNELLIDSSGQHIAYLACDPKVRKKGQDERRGVVVYDGNIVGGPYPGVTALYMSPSGKHIAYTLDLPSKRFYLDKKVLVRTRTVVDAVWSPDEKHLAFIAAGEHGKFFVACDGKRSPLFERIGRIGWSADGKTIEFVGEIDSKVIAVRQTL